MFLRFRGRAVRLHVPLVLLVCAAFVAGCSGGSEPSTATVASVTVAPATPTLVVGVSQQFTATLKDADGQILADRAVTWSSSTPVTATIDASTGMLAAVAAGTTTITATVEGHSGSATVTITAAPAKTFAQLAGAGSNGCGLTADGAAYCFGPNPSGQVGDGTTIDRAVPVAVQTSLRFTSLGFSGTHGCALTASGAAHCWGDNMSGELGVTSAGDCQGTPCSPTPVAVSGGLTFQTLAVGGFHTCGLTAAGAAYCWGANRFGQLGGGDTSAMLVTPRLVTSGRTYTAIAAGGHHTCAIATGGTVYCWGLDDGGALGIDRMASMICEDGPLNGPCAPTPVAVGLPGGAAAAKVAASYNDTCAITTAGDAYCWGSNRDHQTGPTTPSPTCTYSGDPCVVAPALVSTTLRFTAIAPSINATCGLATGGGLYCWGRLDAFADTAVAHTGTPVRVGTGTYSAVATGVSGPEGTFGGTACAKQTGGEYVCWGYQKNEVPLVIPAGS